MYSTYRKRMQLILNMKQGGEISLYTYRERLRALLYDIERKLTVRDPDEELLALHTQIDKLLLEISYV